MNFELGNVLQRAWQITRNHRVLWVFAMLPMLPFAFILPFFLYFFLIRDVRSMAAFSFEDPGVLIALLGVILLVAAFSAILQIFSRAATTFGIYQAETRQAGLSFREVARGGRVFFGRILGAILLVGIGMMAFFALFSACLSVIGLVTFGIGSVLGQFIYLPAVLAAYALTEQTQSAIVADALNPVDALVRAWDLLREHVHVYLMVAGILYFGLSLVGGLAALPVVAPLFLLLFSRFSGELADPSALLPGVLFFVALLPLYLIFQACATLYIKTTFMLTYLRLTRSTHLQPLPVTREATP